MGSEKKVTPVLRSAPPTPPPRSVSVAPRPRRCSPSPTVKSRKSSLSSKRYQYNDTDNKLDLSIKPLAFERSLCAAAQAEALKYKLLAGTPVRNAANNVMGTVMRQGTAVGCEVRISGKVRGQRAKAQKY